MSSDKTTPFHVDHKNLFLITQSSPNGSEIVKICGGETISTPQKLPIGLVCHARKPHKLVETQYMYDVACSIVTSQKIEISPQLSVYAIHLGQCKIIHIEKDVFGKEQFYVDVPAYHKHFYNVLQVSDQNVTLKEYVSGKSVDGRFDCLDCWITPIKSAHGSEWVIVPLTDPILPKKIFSYSKLYEKMTAMVSPPLINIGVVVAIGKIAVHIYLINCSPKFQLGSTRICEIKELEINSYKAMVLVRSKPVELKKRYLETFVTSRGNVMIRTVLKQPRLGEWTVKEPTLADTVLDATAKLTITPPNYNRTFHPIFGTMVFFSNKMVWSAPTLRVILGTTVCTALHIKSSKNDVALNMKYYVMAFHDGEKYWRVPDVPPEMNDSKNFLIKHRLQVLGDPPGTNRKRRRLPPAAHVEPAVIEGRFLSNQFIKHSEYIGQKIVRANEFNKPKEEDDELFVKLGFLQVSQI